MTSRTGPSGEVLIVCLLGERHPSLMCSAKAGRKKRDTRPFFCAWSCLRTYIWGTKSRRERTPYLWTSDKLHGCSVWLHSRSRTRVCAPARRMPFDPSAHTAGMVSTGYKSPGHNKRARVCGRMQQPSPAIRSSKTASPAASCIVHHHCSVRRLSSFFSKCLLHSG